MTENGSFGTKVRWIDEKKNGCVWMGDKSAVVFTSAPQTSTAIATRKRFDANDTTIHLSQSWFDSYGPSEV
jgi:hypothetical protein